LFVIDLCTKWFCCLIKYDVNAEKFKIHEFHDIPNRVSNTDFCANIFSRPYDIKDEWELTIGSQRGFYGWHIGDKDYDRIIELCKASKAVDVFEKLSKY
jgi:hypothetical protein